MATKTPSGSKPTELSIAVQARFQGTSGNTQKVDAQAYVFSSEAVPLGSAPINEKGEARFSIQANAPADNLRVLVGPRLDDKQPELDELIRRGAIEQHLAYRPGQRELVAALTGAMRIDSGQVRIEVNQRYALKDAAQAHRDLEARMTTGSTILLP